MIVVGDILHAAKNDETRDNVKNVYADKSARSETKVQMKQKDKEHSDGPQAINVAPIAMTKLHLVLKK
jgi:hypothetical protein